MAPFKLALLLAVAAVAVMADDSPYSYRPPQTAPRYEQPSSEEESNEDAKYDFDWQVDEDYNKFSQQEQRDGDNTQGSYYVVLPDGRRQTVTYYVDGDFGFVADVKYSGEVCYSEESSQEYRAPRPAYQAPRSPTTIKANGTGMMTSYTYIFILIICFIENVQS